mmetsp:Transcript_22910/g.59791  ORF Transcript_22910/g.59791 Transcript_22910/m.59791 type:complete len:463 (+) Transcript_22910:282-1670(+)
MPSKRDSDEGEDEELDPRVEGALGRLNAATDDINKFEKDLDESKKAFKSGMAQMQVDLAVAAQKCGKKSIEKARPYHTALFQARKSHFEARRAAQMYEAASAKQRQSKQQVAKFEKILMKGGSFDPKLQAKLNAATQNVGEADRRKRVAAEMHAKTTQAFLSADLELMTLTKSRKKVILKTQPYFTAKDRHDKALTALKRDLMTHEASVKDAKKRVAAALKELETISNEIHESRQKRKAEAAENGDGADGKDEDIIKAKIAAAQAKEAQRETEEKEREVREKAEDAAQAAAAAAAAAAAVAAVGNSEGDDEDDVSLAEVEIDGSKDAGGIDPHIRDMQELMTHIDDNPAPEDGAGAAELEGLARGADDGLADGGLGDVSSLSLDVPELADDAAEDADGEDGAAVGGEKEPAAAAAAAAEVAEAEVGEVAAQADAPTEDGVDADAVAEVDTEVGDSDTQLTSM